jgi:Kef-type K+ transport system membrane component KefB
MSALLLLLVQVLAIVALARVVSLIATRLGQPAVVGEMVAGVLLGPSVLGWMFPSLAEALFPAGSLTVLNGLGQVGLVLFMFLVGLRVDPAHLRDGSRKVALLATCGTAFPFVLGCVVGWFWLTGIGLDVPHRWPAILFIGLAMSITAFPVLARILDDHRLQRTRIGTIAISCAAVDDAVAWLVLAVLTAIASGSDSYVWQRLTGLLVFGAAVVVVRPLLARLLERAPHVHARLGILLIAVIASAATTEAVGVHAFFGAFFVGVVLAADVRTHVPEIEAMIEPLATVLLLPVYFAFSGLRTDVTALTASPRLAAITGAVLAVAILSKLAPPVLLAGRLGLPRRESWMLGLLLNTRGMVELVVLNVGFEAGLIPKDVFSALVFMAIVTTAMASPFLIWLRREEVSPVYSSLGAIPSWRSGPPR